MANIRIALAQINPTVGDLKANKTKISDCVRKAYAQQADIVIFPELALTGYPPEDLLLKEHFILENLKLISQLAKEVKDVLVVVGFVDRDKNKNLYNAAALIYQGKVRAVYYKKQLPNYGVFDEKRYFTPGKSAPVFYYRGISVGVTICEDIWVDQGAHWEQAQKGAKLILNISSSPFDVNKLEVRQELIKRQAKKIKCSIAYVNLVGGQDELVFDGSSFIVSPQGEIVYKAQEFVEDVGCFDLSFKPEKIKRNWIGLDKKVYLNAKQKLNGVKTKSLNQIERIFRALVLGTKDYVQKNRFKKVLIGLSGGIDSALVAAIAVEAIGKDNVVGVSMPSRFNSEGTRNDARLLARELGIKFYEIPIEGILKGYTESLSEVFKGVATDITEENLQARIRGNILMALSNKFGWLVLTTGNKSEIAVGYCTLYGDMSGGYAVIKDVLKTKVYELSNFINSHLGSVIPQSIIDRAPSAELRDNQKDQDSLPAYDDLDEMLAEYVEKHQSFGSMAKNHDLVDVKKVISLVDRSEYKRRQSPPGVKITARAFGKDWRLPITNQYKEF